MMRKIIALLLCCMSCFAFAMTKEALLQGCEQAVPTTNPNFCSSFERSAYCHCLERSPDAAFCDTMNNTYIYMFAYFGSLDSACQYGEEMTDGVAKQTCINDWNCYWNGGSDSQGGLCRSTGQRCASR